MKEKNEGKRTSHLPTFGEPLRDEMTSTSSRQSGSFRRSGKWRSALMVVVILTGCVGLAGVMFASRPKPKRQVSPSMAVSVAVMPASWKEHTLMWQGFGTTVAAREASVVPESSGRVTYVSPSFRTGAFVKRGRLLFRVDRRRAKLEVKRLERQLSSLRKQAKLLTKALALDRNNIQRNQRLLRKKVIDAGSYEKMQIRIVERNQRLESLRQSASATEVQLADAKIRLRNASFYAPFDARVVKGELTAGTYVSQGHAVGTLQGLRAIEVPVAFRLQDLQQLKDERGRPVPMGRWVSFLKRLPPVEIVQERGGRKMRWLGRVERVGARIDLKTRTLSLWVRIPLRQKRRSRDRAIPARQEDLLPGVFCRVRIPVQRKERVIRVPRSAVYGRDLVFVYEKGHLRRKTVTITHRDGDYAYLTGGVKAGDAIVVSPLIDPIDGMRVLLASPGV